MMQVEGFAELTPRRLHLTLIAMNVRNVFEAFHVGYLSHERVAGLDHPIIRQGILDTLVMIEQVDDGDTADGLTWLIMMIPESRAIPNAGHRITET